MIEEAERLLRDLGFLEVRVRHHELKTGDLARIELGPAELAKVLSNGVMNRLDLEIRGMGYQHVTLDLQGYRRGSLNEPAASPA